MTQLIIAEKPSVAGKIANAIGRAHKKSRNGAPYYEVDAPDGKAIVAPAVGHVYTLQETQNKKWNLEYPVFDIQWVPIYQAEKGASYTKSYVSNIKELCKEADSYVNACDYDVEGSVIGYNVLKHACGADPEKDKIKRMHFSTVTTPDLVRAYNEMEEFDDGQTQAGLTRHVLDWYYGINLSRALISALRSTRTRGTLSIGRVQGPALKLIVDKEREIRAFVPEPYWVISALLNKDKDFEAVHVKEKFEKEEEAKAAYEKVKGQKTGTVKSVDRKKYKQPPPNPFDLTSLQVEAHRHHRIAPKQTLEIGQTLYERGYISYPRTSSQQLPPSIGYKKILDKIAQQSEYSEGAEKLLSKPSLRPNNGKKKDPAHPAIYPTGEVPKGIADREKRVYDLIVRRFMATFGEWAVRESMKAIIDINTEDFKAEGKRTVEKNWHELYGKYAKFDEVMLPDLKEGESVDIKKLGLDKKMTQPPKRYTESSIISELEKRNLGTKCAEYGTEIYIKRNGKISKVPIGKFVDKQLKSGLNSKEIKKGTHTLCCDIKNHRMVWKPISSVSRRPVEENELKEVMAAGSSIKLTNEHPVAILKENAIKFKEVKKLKIGDNLIRARPIRWDPKSRVIANMIGDGSISIRKDIHEKTPDMRYHNKELALIDVFSSAANIAFCAGAIKRKASRGRYYVALPLAAGRKILQQYPEIEKGEFPESIDKPTAIGAFFDDEGCVYLEQIKEYGNIQSSGVPKIKMAQKIRGPLDQISLWLRDLGISSKVYKTNVNYRGSKRECYELWVRGRKNLERFMRNIPFFHPRKFEKLMLGLSRYPSVLKKARIYRNIDLQGNTHDSDLSKSLGLSLTHTRALCRELEEDGLIKITRKPNLKRRSANNSLCLTVSLPYFDTFYSRLGDICLSSKMTAVPVSGIRPAWSTHKFVYDITVDSETPNYFAGHCGLLIHNSTRATVIDTLFKRNYIIGKSIEATDLGVKTVETLEKHSPEILDEELTRSFEEEMDELMGGKKTGEEVEAKNRHVLLKVLEKFKKEEKEIGEELRSALFKAQEEKAESDALGKCPVCKEGLLVIRRNPKTKKRFLGCSNYPKCTETQPLPQKGSVKPAKKDCPTCGYPMANVWSRGKKAPWVICTNINCPSKKKK